MEASLCPSCGLRLDASPGAEGHRCPLPGEAEELELDWGERGRPGLAPSPFAMAPAPELWSPPAREPRSRLVIDLDGLPHLAARLALLALAVGLGSEAWAALRVLVDWIWLVVEPGGAPAPLQPTRLAILGAGAGAFALWGWALSGPRRDRGVPLRTGALDLLLAPLSALRELAEPPGQASGLGGLAPRLLLAAGAAGAGHAAWAWRALHLHTGAGLGLRLGVAAADALALGLAYRFVQRVTVAEGLYLSTLDSAASWRPLPPPPPPLPSADACADCGAPARADPCPACGAARAPHGYRVARVLARRPHGRTYLAVDPGGEPVVLKEVVFARAPDVKALDAFEREAALLATLRHPQIPALLDHFQTGAGAGLRLYLVQQFFEGPSLEQELATGRRFSADEVLALSREVLGALAHLHGQKPPVVHRDVKPANLIRLASGRVALVDFGAARDLVRATEQGTLVGTVGYMPREQLAGQVDPTCDLYAWGASAVHLLTGRHPAELLTPEAELALPADLPAPRAVRRFLRRLVAPRRQDRFPSAAAALRALDGLGGGPGPGLRLAAAVAVAVAAAAGALASGGWP